MNSFLPAHILVVTALLGGANPLLATSAGAASQKPAGQANESLKAVENPRAWGDEFVRKLQQDAGAAFETMKGVIRNEDLQRVRKAASTLVENAGPVLGWEFIGEEKLGSATLRLSYMVRYQRRPVLFHMFLYAPEQKGWLLTGVEFVVDPVRFPFPNSAPLPARSAPTR